MSLRSSVSASECSRHVYWSVTSSSKRGKDGVKGNSYLAFCNFHFIREHKNLVKDPSNNKSIILVYTSYM